MEAKDLKLVENNESDQGFVIDDDLKATWCMRKIRHMKEKKRENKELAEEQIAEIKKEIAEVEAWLESENGKLDNSIGFMESKLEHYARQLKEDDPELKTHKLPFGTLKFRAQRPKWEYDDGRLLEFSEANLLEVVKIEKKVDKRELKKRLDIVGGRAVVKDTGQIVEGIEIIDRPEKLKIDV